MKEWWDGLDGSAQDWFLLSGALMLFVVGVTVGVIGAVNVGTLEPLMHLGFSVGLASALGTMFTAMARLA